MRLLVNALLILFLGLAFGALLIMSTPFFMFSGFSIGPPTPTADKAEVEAVAKAGAPVAQAIYRYQNETGLFPEKLEDLGRFPSTMVEPDGWAYLWRYWESQLWYRGDKIPSGLSYSFREEEPGWSWSGNLTGGTKLDAAVAPPERALRTDSERYHLLADELEWRIGRSPNEAVHHQGLISHRMRHGDCDAALRDAIRMHEARLRPTWELDVLARLLDKCGRDNWAERELRQEAEKQPRFVQWFRLAEFHHDAGRHDQAFRLLDEACRSPYIKGNDDTHIPEYYFWLAANYAYEQNRHELAVKLCDYWEKWNSQRSYGGENSFHAVRAAANLALGNLQSARRDIDHACRARQATWADRLPELQAAISRGEKTFSWRPGGNTKYEILIDYR